MNSLSWFLYLADVLPSLASTVGVPAVIVAICAPIAVGFVWMMSQDSGAPQDIRDNITKALKATIFKLVPACFVLIVLASLVPSKETIYLIAGSEASEFVVTSDYGQEVLGDIKSIIEAQLEELKGKPNE